MRYGGILRGNKLPPKRSASNYPNKTKVNGLSFF